MPFSTLIVAVKLFGAGPGSNFDFARFSFQVPEIGSSAARAAVTTPTNKIIAAKHIAALVASFFPPIKFQTLPAYTSPPFNKSREFPFIPNGSGGSVYPERSRRATRRLQSLFDFSTPGRQNDVIHLCSPICKRRHPKLPRDLLLLFALDFHFPPCFPAPASVLSFDILSVPYQTPAQQQGPNPPKISMGEKMKKLARSTSADLCIRRFPSTPKQRNPPPNRQVQASLTPSSNSSTTGPKP